MVDVSLGGGVLVITGVMASGKSTVAQLLAERLPRAVHVRGDVFRRMLVSGRRDLVPHSDEEAFEQLRLRYRVSASTADLYAAAGWTAIVQDVVLGENLRPYLDAIGSRPLHLVVLAPSPEAVAAREAARAKTGYGSWTVGGLDHILRDRTPRLGLWVDTSAQSPDETVDAILDGLKQALIAE
ncbi:Adenylylsulfate kinase [Streptomyces sp. DvalAA-14]|uniref:AAA family ATPase n=1 Tax=unclassified Streptomyces TaxID=2593676 RepID=UPI00081B7FBE|nr:MULTISPECIES: AAA family ATPase [unclassified Streptomyces]MYS19728.1 AAA family ATPase [Streptomyces sp. SID4948]SCD51651.1 Adenylylsulfate kinase [Streptomyces sp. DvalAA-14]